MLGISLLNEVREEAGGHEYAIFGYHGGPVSITDGRYVYMCAAHPQQAQLNEYTLFPTHMNTRFTVEELKNAKMTEPMPFTKGCPVLKIPVRSHYAYKLQSDVLFDLKRDPGQNSPVENEEEIKRFQRALIDIMGQNDAPEELYTYYGLTK